MITNNWRIGVLGVGGYLPEKQVSNAFFETSGMDTSSEWISTRTGIHNRHIKGPTESTSDMAVLAAQMALDQAGVSPNTLDGIWVATSSPDNWGFPSTACRVQQKLGITRAIPCMDIAAACSGFCYGVATAYAYCAAGLGKTYLVIGAESMSDLVDWQDRRTAILFGDGAGAAVIGPVATGGIQTVDQGADGHSHDILTCSPTPHTQPFYDNPVSEPRPVIHMNGPAVFKKGVTVVVESIMAALSACSLSVNDLDYVVCHQANQRILEAVSKKTTIPLTKFLINIDTVGNTSAASIPLVLTDAIHQNRLKPGDRLCLVGFGAGFTWSTIIIEWSIT